MAPAKGKGKKAKEVAFSPVEELQVEQLEEEDQLPSRSKSSRSSRSKGKKKMGEASQVEELREEDQPEISPPSSRGSRRKGKEKQQAQGDQPAFDIFVNAEAELKYEEIKKKDLLPERGFEASSGQLPHFLVAGITNHGWESFCKKPDPAIASLVREFYANLDECEEHQVVVRGRIVEWSPEAINSLYNLPDLPQATFNQMAIAPSSSQLNAAIKVVGIEGAQWRVSSTGARSFLAAYLKPEANVWLSFIKMRLLPTTHDNTMSKERILLTFAIMQVLSIDVGRVIAKEMLNCSRKKSGKLKRRKF